MVLYGVVHHYEMTGDSEPVKLFKTHKEAMEYFLKKFDEWVDRFASYEDLTEFIEELGESFVFSNSAGCNDDLEDYCTTRTQAKNNEQFYVFDSDFFSLYKIEQYEI